VSFLGLDSAVARPGQIACICGAEGAAGDESQASLVWRLAAGFGLSVLAQALIIATLPVAAAAVAPRPGLAGWPFALTLLGAACATLPASFLLDVFGRRAAFALGTSFGIAGGALLAWSILGRNFPGLCLGGFWLGLAQGFALFYRHAAALGAAARTRSALTVFAGGAIAALGAPLLLHLAESAGGPLVAAAAALLAAMVYLAALPISLTLPHALAPAIPHKAHFSFRALGSATVAGALAWFGMAHAMSGMPGLLAGCGATAATIGGVVSLHLLAMYGPVAFFAGVMERLSGGTLAATGLGTIFVGLALPIAATGLAAGSTGMIMAGLGWSLANAGEMRMLHAEGTPPAGLLALHDAALLAAALAGAVLI
jgi:MFS family permease